MNKGHRLLCAFILAVFLFPGCAAGERAIPDCLRFKQHMKVTHLGMNRDQYVVTPETVQPRVNEEISAVVEELRAEAEPYLAEKGAPTSFADRLDAGPTITRVGDRWMSFLSIARVTHGGNQVFAASDARVYNMETGERVYLEDILTETGWEYLEGKVRTGLEAHFPDLQPDRQALENLCGQSSLSARGFTLSPGHMSLHFHSHELYPDAPEGLMRVDISYTDLKPYMTETALTETDCSGYQLVALTYDDGPSPASEGLINQLRLYGAQATFFIVGSMIAKVPSVLHREYDAGYSVQSHNWLHEYEDITPEKVAEWAETMDREMSGIIGIAPTLMRAPGGNEMTFIRAGSKLPQIHWTRSSGDAGKPSENDILRIGGMVAGAHDGDIVLCHDLRSSALEYAAFYLPRLEKRNVLLVTVQDLCSLRGITPEEGMFLIGCPPAETAE